MDFFQPPEFVLDVLDEVIGVGRVFKGYGQGISHGLTSLNPVRCRVSYVLSGYNAGAAELFPIWQDKNDAPDWMPQRDGRTIGGRPILHIG